MRSDERAQAPEPLTLLSEGQVEVEGRLPWSSNGTFLVRVCLQGAEDQAVYKPEAGEGPMWDFPHDRHRRELAAYVLSEALGWGIVPETVVRAGPLGYGSLQRFVSADFEEHYFTLLEHPEHHDALRTMCAFDLIANNADRKGGHCLLGVDGLLWSVDHGLCFHADPKLRTVIWDFAGQPVPEALVADAARLAVSVPVQLAALLDDDEREALAARAAALVRKPVFPEARSGRPYPWPMV